MGLPQNIITRACTRFLRLQQDSVLAAINGAIVADYVGVKPVPSFNIETWVGEIPNPPSPYFTVCFASSNNVDFLATGTGNGGHEQLALTLNLKCLIPLAGDNTPLNYELMLQCAVDETHAWMDNSLIALSPVITHPNAPGEQAKAFMCGRGPIMTIFPHKSADGKTMIRGWTVPFTFNFDVAGGQVLSS